MPKPRGGSKPRPGGKVSSSHRFTVEALELVDWLAEKLGLTKSGVLELAIRRMAAGEGAPPRLDRRETDR